MLKTDAVVVGAGHCGLAMSRCLADGGIDHIVLERGEVANSWRTQRWDSLRLLTPNWMTRLPGYSYSGGDPDGYLTASGTADLITHYAKETAAPVRANTAVLSVRPVERGYVVQTDQDRWYARAVLSASGAAAVPHIPALKDAVPDGIATLTPTGYRNPDELPDGGVLVVGSSASGVQIAEELHRSGRPVTIAVGEHTRMPRTYRGKDILWWMDAAGLFDERYDQIPDLVRARRLPSMQLVGSPERKTLDLNALRRLGVRIVGRLAGIRDGVAQFSGALANVTALADLKLGRLLDTFDRWAVGNELETDGIDPPQRYASTAVPVAAPLSLDLGSGEIRTIMWANGFRPDLSWIDAPVFDRKGWVRHEGGVTASPGLYLIGMPFLRRRKSTLIDGAAADAADLTEHLARYLATA